MKTPAATKPRLAALAAVALAFACGTQDHGARYGDKAYGHPPPSDDARPAPEDEELELPAPAPPAAPAPAPAPGPEPEVTPTPEPETPVIDDPETPDEPVTPADTLIQNQTFGLRFDTDSAVGIRDSSGFRSLGLAGNSVRSNLVTAPTDNVKISQTFGDGVARSLGAQSQTLDALDAGRLEGTPSVSGVTVYDRVVAAGLAPTLLWVERLRFTPVDGDGRTVCFFDRTSGARIAFPYSVLPNYKADAFALDLGDYGPYRAVSYPGDAVDCAAPDVAPLASELVNVRVTAESAADVPYYLHTVAPLAGQHVVTMTTTRATDDLVAPYTDETVLLSYKSRYVMNQDVGTYVKIILTMRQSVDIAAQSGGGILGGIAGLLINLDGVAVDLHVELCRDLLVPGGVDHCGGTR